MPADFYDVLGVSRDASPDELRAAFRSRVREYHPDVNDAPNADEQFKLVRKAHEVLSNGAERKDYDRLGHREYVSRHLDGVPPFSAFENDEGPVGERIAEAQAVSSAPSSGSGGSAPSSGSSGSATSSGPTASSGSTASSGTSSTSATTSTSTSTSASTASTGTSSGTGRSARRSGTGAGNGTGQSSWESATTGTGRASSRTSRSTAAGRRRALRRWWAAAFLGLAVYLGGLGVYLSVNRAAALALLDSLLAAPAATLAGPLPLAAPLAMVLDLVAAPAATPAVLFPAGVVLLPLVLVTAVSRFGRGIAWTYALGSLGPLAVTLAGFAVSPAAWAVLLGLVLFPLLGAAGFLVDVGRYLLASRG